MKREDNYSQMREKVKDLTDEQLYDKFWSLLDEVTQPLVKLGYEYTSPAVERSVLLRMGFSSLEAKAIVDGCISRSLLGHGAGNVVYKLAMSRGVDVREAGLLLVEGKSWEEAEELFKGGRE